MLCATPSSLRRDRLQPARRDARGAVAALLPHALLELWALFLPLGAWLLASRRARWDELLAATVVTVAIAVPALVVSSLVEVYVSPHLVAGLATAGALPAP